MQFTIDIPHDLVDKIVWFLEAFKDRGLKISETTQTPFAKEALTDEYIEKNWQEVVSAALANYDDSYEKSFDYKIERANFQDLKGNM